MAYRIFRFQNSILTLQKLKDLKLKNTTVSCIVIEKHVHIDTPGADFDSPTATYSYEYKYYAKGIGLVKHEGSCYGCLCGNLAPSGGKISLFNSESTSK